MDGGIKVGPFGGSGGTYSDTGAADRLESIKIRCGDAIDGIIVTYDLDGKRETRRFGRGGGVEETINFVEGEHLKEVSGHFGTYFHDSRNTIAVRSLTFRSNLRTYGPYGKEEGTHFSVPVVNGKIVGFFGRSGELVNAIGVFIV